LNAAKAIWLNQLELHMRFNRISNKALSVFIFVRKIKSTYLDTQKRLQPRAEFGP